MTQSFFSLLFQAMGMQALNELTQLVPFLGFAVNFVYLVNIFEHCSYKLVMPCLR